MADDHAPSQPSRSGVGLTSPQQAPITTKRRRWPTRVGAIGPVAVMVAVAALVAVALASSLDDGGDKAAVCEAWEAYERADRDQSKEAAQRVADAAMAADDPALRQHGELMADALRRDDVISFMGISAAFDDRCGTGR